MRVMMMILRGMSRGVRGGVVRFARAGVVGLGVGFSLVRTGFVI
jgi:hypothetical protein